MSQQPQSQQLQNNLAMSGMQYQLQQQLQPQNLDQEQMIAPPHTFYQPQLQQQQQQLTFFDPTRTADNTSFIGAEMAGQQQPTFQEMMYLQQQHQQQQQRRGSDAAAQAAALNLKLGGYTESMGQQQYPIITPQVAQHQFDHQQQMWMNDSAMQQQPQQQMTFQEQLQFQQQLMSGTAAYNNYLPQQHLQQQFEPLRRRSSMSSTGSLSPIGPGHRPSLGNPNLMLGNADYARFLATGGSLAQTLSHAPQQQILLQQQQHDDPMLGGIGGGVGITAHLQQPVFRKEKKKRTKSFPEKLMQGMLEHANENAVAWLPDGKSFVIVSPDLFVVEVLNYVFKEAKYASFVRKLHRWGFVRLTSGTGTDCFHHPLFNRNRREWAAKITCVPVRETREKTKPRGGNGTDKLPPSLAGVERFIRAKAAAAAALAEHAGEMKGKLRSLPSMAEGKYADGSSLDYSAFVKQAGHLDPLTPSHLAEKGTMNNCIELAEFVKGAKDQSPGSNDESLNIGASTEV